MQASFRYPESVLTFFSTAKPFCGNTAFIQRNALKSWTLVHPDAEVILFGDDDGAAQVCAELGLRHEPYVERNEFGTKRLDYLFARAQAIARYDLLCYANCDMILLSDFCRALHRLRAAHDEFLMIGRRTNVDVLGLWPFEDSSWEVRLRSVARRSGKRRPPDWIDYFAFTRGLFGADIPPFALRVVWDNWLVWRALDLRKPVVDASPVVLAIHQNHDYGYHPQGKPGVWHGPEAGRNAQLAGGWKHMLTIADSTEVLHERGLSANWLRKKSSVKRYARQGGRVLFYDGIQRLWFLLMGLTRPLRHRLGLRAAPRSRP